MAAKNIIILLSVLAVTSHVQSQFYDLFQEFQPYLQTYPTTKRPDFARQQQTSQKRPKPHSRYEENDDISISTFPKPTSKPRRKPSQQTNLNTYTTAKPLKSTKSSQWTANRSTTRSHHNEALNGNIVKVNQDRRHFYDDNNIAGNHYTEEPNYATTRRSTAVQYRPSTFTTFNPLYNRPGVRPAVVDQNQPPITNKPVTKRPLAVYPRPTDSSVIRFPQDPDTSPEVVSGIDEDAMSYAERRRYVEMAERMCDKYKALSVKKLEAIPLVPSPEPVQVNVSVCAPTNVPLVVGGKVVTIKEFPHMALLGWTKIQDAGYSWKCGGTLVSDQYVLTAGHCAYQEKDDSVVTGAPRVVQLGSSYLDDQGALVMKIITVVRHPKYVQTRSYYDIALVKMVKPVTFSEVVRPACLGEPPGVGEPIIATGWGRTEFGGTQSLELRSVSIPIWDMDECKQALGTSRKLPNGPSRDSQICAGEKKGGKDTCQGDSGGPAQIQDGCTWRVIAVTSVGRSCGAPNTPALYATIHKAFISAQIFGKTSQNSQTNYQSNAANNRNQNNNANNNRNNRNDNNHQSSITNANRNTNSNRNQNNNANFNTNSDNHNSNDRNDYYNNPSTHNVYNSNNDKINYPNSNNNGNTRFNSDRRPNYDNIPTNDDNEEDNNGRGYHSYNNRGDYGNEYNRGSNRNNNARQIFYSNQDYSEPVVPDTGMWNAFVF